LNKIWNHRTRTTQKSAAANNVDLIVRPAEKRDLETVWRLFEDNFGALGLGRVKKRWRWQFIDNPACCDQKSSIWVAEMDGSVIAQLAAFPVRMKIMDQEMIIQWECDFVVDQQIRRLNPIWPMQFLREVLQKNPSPLKGGNEFASFPVKGAPKHVSPHLLLREKWLNHRRVYNASICRRPYRKDHTLRTLAKKGKIARRILEGPLGAIGSAILALTIRIFNRLYQTPLADPNLTVGRIYEAGPEFDALWMHLRDKYPITTVRDQRFIRWRFFNDPIFENVLFGAYDVHGKLYCSSYRADGSRVACWTRSGSFLRSGQ
jgi:hypothetical protein